jgi:hypothetical protein
LTLSRCESHLTHSTHLAVLYDCSAPLSIWCWFSFLRYAVQVTVSAAKIDGSEASSGYSGVFNIRVYYASGRFGVGGYAPTKILGGRASWRADIGGMVIISCRGYSVFDGLGCCVTPSPVLRYVIMFW